MVRARSARIAVASPAPKFCNRDCRSRCHRLLVQVSEGRCVSSIPLATRPWSVDTVYADFECLTDRDCERNQRCAGPPYQICIPFASFPASLFPPLETNVDRPGNDLWSFIMWVHDPQVCRSECSGNSQCRAFTYVKPGFQGPFARCYIKRATGTARPNTCCISGVPAGR